MNKRDFLKLIGLGSLAVAAGEIDVGVAPAKAEQISDIIPGEGLSGPTWGPEIFEELYYISLYDWLNRDWIDVPWDGKRDTVVYTADRPRHIGHGFAIKERPGQVGQYSKLAIDIRNGVHLATGDTLTLSVSDV